MKGKVIYKPFFIFFVYPLQGPSPVGKLTLKNLKTHFSFYLYIYTPKLGVAIILKRFFVFMTHPTDRSCSSCSSSFCTWPQLAEDWAELSIDSSSLSGYIAGPVVQPGCESRFSWNLSLSFLIFLVVSWQFRVVELSSSSIVLARLNQNSSTESEIIQTKSNTGANTPVNRVVLYQLYYQWSYTYNIESTCY